MLKRLNIQKNIYACLLASKTITKLTVAVSIQAAPRLR